MSKKTGLTITEKGGFVFLDGVFDEYADFSSLKAICEPIRFNLRAVRRINSIGMRNLLSFLIEWGDRALEYHECPTDFIEQINMIPA